MSASELVDVFLQMLLAEVMIRPVVSALQHRPERFDAVCMRLPSHELFDRVLDRLVSAIDADEACASSV